MDTKTIDDIIKIRKQIRNKFKAIKLDKIKRDLTIQDQLKPISEPLNQLVQNVSYKPIVEKHKENSLKKFIKDEEINIKPEKHENKSMENEDEDEDDESTFMDASTFIDASSTPIKSNSNDTTTDVISSYLKYHLQNKLDDLDKTYGLYYDDNDELRIGNSKVKIEPDHLIIKDKSYPISKGLLELLVMKRPNNAEYDELDLKNYGTILYDTNAYFRKYDSTKGIQGSKSTKYKKIIKPLIHKGGGIFLKDPIFMKLRQDNTDYIYWDDPNELVERLKLLVTSQQAGNNNHQNEIISIIEELREANIIE